MKLFDLFKFVVKLHSSWNGFFTSCGVGFLQQIVNSDQGAFPLFDENKPILYPFRSSCFVARELRRAGYNAHVFPYFLLILRDLVRAFVSRLKARIDAKNKWKS